MQLRVSDVELGGERLVIVSFPLPDGGTISSLSAAEREVAGLLCRGLSNKCIAEIRGTSSRTIANQVASCMRKVGAGSRVELAAALAGMGRGR